MSQSDAHTVDESSLVDNAVAQGGAYEVIRNRLSEQGKSLKEATDGLNQERLAEFGSTDMDVLARIRVRTENNCVARDIVQVGDYLLFGYNVFIGLKKETKVEDVFSLFAFKEVDGQYELEEVPREQNFLYETGFRNDFEELYRYYKHTKLTQLTVKNGRLLAAFQIGERIEDMRVFRWGLSADGKEVTYMDNRGERDIQLPKPYDFEWTQTQREDIVHGRHAHINIADKVFIDTLAGDLTIKIENNTEDGLGIYREPVDDKTQSLDDADVAYAIVGELVLIKVKPYREEKTRYFIFNPLTETAHRIDAIGESCLQLPEDHGVIFPGGYYLQTGEYKTFDEPVAGLRFKRMIRSPNGEDALFIFYEPVEGVVALFSYNLIEKALQNPIFGHGYALFEDGRIVIFTAEEEPARIHPMQIWSSPFASAEYASKQPVKQSFYGRIGNAELVRGVSDLYSIYRLIRNQSVSLKLYEELSRTTSKIFDNHYWLAEKELATIGELLKNIEKTAELVIDEFEKVESIRQQSAKAMQEATTEQEKLVAAARFGEWDTVTGYIDTLAGLRKHQGRLITLRDYRYIDLKKIDSLNKDVEKLIDELSEKTVNFLSSEEALTPYKDQISTLLAEAESAKTSVELEPMMASITGIADSLDLVSELMATLNVADPTLRTEIIDRVSEVYASLNQAKAKLANIQKSMGSAESEAQFAAQFKLFSQSINNALGQSKTPEQCDEQLARLLVQLEEFESQFSDIDAFLADIVAKREEVQDAFESHRQTLLDERQQKATSISDAAKRMLASIDKRAMKFTNADELNTYFASDVLVSKVRELVEKLRGLSAAVQADDIDAKFKAIKEQAIRALRDKSDIFEDGGKVIKLGPRHRFSVNQQVLDLTLIPRQDALCMHLTGTDFYEVIEDAELNALKPFWKVALMSESPSVYRAEYLAYQIWQRAEMRTNDLSMQGLTLALADDKTLTELVRKFSAPRYKEGYEKGVHDHDAVLILKQLLPAAQKAGTLVFDAFARGLAQLFWCYTQDDQPQVEPSAKRWNVWASRAQSAHALSNLFGSHKANQLLIEEITQALKAFAEQHAFVASESQLANGARYLTAELSDETFGFSTTRYASSIIELLQTSIDIAAWDRFRSNLRHLQQAPAAAWATAKAWLEGLLDSKQNIAFKPYIDEAAAMLVTDKFSSGIDVPCKENSVDLELKVSGLLGQHDKLAEQTLSISLTQFLVDLEQHESVYVRGYNDYQQCKANVIARERKRLRIEEFMPRPLSSFVRNRLINESYLPLIGDNLAKQMGIVGENKRTDLMGLLMMISPPGYGKTTLMEYVASRLGLIFMKINCPSLGHDVVSLDPAQAPNATARQELIKLNLSLEMGNNVMLYLDDIQHTHPEFLQKFISLCDGTRRVEGVWKDQTKTYDMRGRKFCVVMAGNPYTESGEVFKVPDMLANRADIYNLGDILGGTDEQFAMSYIENSLTSNAVLAPMALRPLEDVYKLIAKAEGEQIANTDLSYSYSGAEIEEICGVLQKMFVVRDVILKVNQQYIASAAQNDQYRTEPPFKLQGSYRNMNKMAEKISSVMTQEELMAMIDDHYLGESQLLTSGAEDNLLKLAELRGTLAGEDAQRWQAIKDEFAKHKDASSDTDGAQRIASKIADIGEALAGVTAQLANSNTLAAQVGDISQAIKGFEARFVQLQSSDSPQAKALEQGLLQLRDVLAGFGQLIQSQQSDQTALARELAAPLTKLQSQMSESKSTPELEALASAIATASDRLVGAVEKSMDFDITIIKRITKLSAELKAFSYEKGLVKPKDDEFGELGE